MNTERSRVTLGSFHLLAAYAGLSHRDLEARLLANAQERADRENVRVCVIVGRRLLGVVKPREVSP